MKTEDFLKRELYNYKDDNLPIMEQILNKYNYGKLTWKFFVISFFILSMEGVHFGFFSQLIIPIQAFYSLSQLEVQFHSSSIFVAIAIGSLSSGYLSKNIARTKIILYLLLIIAIFHIIIGIIHELYIFAVSRFIIGLCLGIITPLMLNIFAEFLPINYRAISLILVWTGLILGQAILAFLNLLIMPNFETNKFPNLVLYSSILSIIPLLISLFFLTDSPRNLILIDQNEQAFKILDEINGESLCETTKEKITIETKLGINSHFYGRLSDVFNKKYIVTSILLSFILIIHGFINFGPFLINSLTMKEMKIEITTKYNKIIWDSFYLKLIIIPPFVLGGILCEIPFLGRNKTAILINIISIIILISLIIVKNNFQVLFGIISSLLGICYSVTSAYTVEVYPTKIRDIASGYFFFIARISAFLSQILFIWFHNLGTWIPYYIVGILIIANILLTFFLPFETYNRNLDFDFENNEKLADESNHLLIKE